MAEKKNKKKTSARKSGSENMRDKINVRALIEALEQHVLGEKEMTATQVNAALALLKKTLPDLSEPVRKLMQEAAPPRAHEDALKELE
jgi:hypothetical protein